MRGELFRLQPPYGSRVSERRGHVGGVFVVAQPVDRRFVQQHVADPGRAGRVAELEAEPHLVVVLRRDERELAVAPLVAEFEPRAAVTAVRRAVADLGAQPARRRGAGPKRDAVLHSLLELQRTLREHDMPRRVVDGRHGDFRARLAAGRVGRGFQRGRGRFLPREFPTVRTGCEISILQQLHARGT